MSQLKSWYNYSKHVGYYCTTIGSALLSLCECVCGQLVKMLIFITGNMQLMPPDSTAVNPSFRTAAHSLSCGHGWIDGRTEDVNVHKGEELAKKIIQLGRGVYFNEPSSYLPNWKTDYWGGHYDRLLRIKQIWDPNNFFTCHHCVGSDIKQPSLVDTIIGK